MGVSQECFQSKFCMYCSCRPFYVEIEKLIFVVLAADLSMGINIRSLCWLHLICLNMVVWNIVLVWEWCDIHAFIEYCIYRICTADKSQKMRCLQFWIQVCYQQQEGIEIWGFYDGDYSEFGLWVILFCVIV